MGYTNLPYGATSFGKIVTKFTTSTLAPTVDFDSVHGFDMGDIHIQTGQNGPILYMCTSPTKEAAVWVVFIGEGADTTNLTEHGKVDVVGGIVKGQPTYISGVSGSIKPQFKLGDRSEHDPAHLAGLAKESKGNNQDIEVIRKGKLVGTTEDPVNTSACSDDPPERLHLGTNGVILGESPGGGGGHIEIGRCLRSHATEGVIEVDIANYIHNLRAWLNGSIVLAGGDDLGATYILQGENFSGDIKATIDTLGMATFLNLNQDVTTGSSPTLNGSNFSNIGATNLDDDLHTLVHTWNGSIIETISITATSNGTVVTANLEKDGGGDLTLIFSDEFSTFDCTPAATISLTAGSDTSPQINYVYIPQSTKALTVSTSGFPAAEYAPVATVLVQSAASVQSDGVYKLHAWRDHAHDTNNQGHLSHINDWIRRQHASWISGIAQTLTITANGGAPDNVIFTTTSGSVYQLHPHPFPAFSGTPDVYVVNDLTTPYNKAIDLNTLLTDSLGNSMSGKYFSLVLWGSVNEASGDCKLFVNLPSGFYNSANGVIRDSDKYTNFQIPADFTGTGFLISELKLRHRTASGGTWTSIQEVDLRGLRPSIYAGSGVAGATEFADNTFKIFDETDATKIIDFQASAITTGNTRTLTMADEDINLTNAVLNASPVVEVDNGDSGASDTITWASGNNQKSTLTANCTYTFTAPSKLANITLKLIQGGIGSFTATWPGSVMWQGGTAPTLTAAPGAIDIINFYYDGTNYFGVAYLDFQV